MLLRLGEQFQFFADESADDRANILTFTPGDFLDALLEFGVQVDRDVEREIRFVELAAFALRNVGLLLHGQS